MRYFILCNKRCSLWPYLLLKLYVGLFLWPLCQGRGEESSARSPLLRSPSRREEVLQAYSAFLRAFGICSLTVRTVTMILCLWETVVSHKVLCSEFPNDREMTRPQGPLGAEQPQVHRFQALRRHQPDPLADLQDTAGHRRRHPSAWPEAQPVSIRRARFECVPHAGFMEAEKCAMRFQMTFATAPLLRGGVCQFPSVRSLHQPLNRGSTAPLRLRSFTR